MQIELEKVAKSWGDVQAVDQVSFSVISAGTLLAVSPLLIAFLLFQRQFVQSFMRSGIK